MAKIDTNADSLDRNRRNWQAIALGAATGTLTLSPTGGIVQTGTGLGLLLDTPSGLAVNSFGLSANPDGHSISIDFATNALQVEVGVTNPTLVRAISGLTVLLSDASLSKAGGAGLHVNIGSGLAVGSNLHADVDGLTINAGPQLAVQFNDASIHYSASLFGGLSVQLDAAGAIGLNAGGLAVKVDAATIKIASDQIGFVAVPVLAADPGGPSDGQVWFNTTALAWRMQNNGMTGGSIWLAHMEKVTGAVVTNTTTRISSYTSRVFPANFFTAGRSLRIHVGGKATGNSGNLTISLLHVDGAAVTTSIISTTIVTPTSLTWDQDFVMTCFTPGVGGVSVFELSGCTVVSGSAGTVLPVIAPIDTGALSPSVDTTQTFTIQAALKWSAASVGDVATDNSFYIEVLDSPT